MNATSPSLPRVVAFEGIDGVGKSTVLGHVAAWLRGRGIPVYLPRTGKEHDSRPTRLIRRLTRDPRNLALDARAELLLYCAREAQVLAELVRPALARGETVLLDRSLLTPIVLGAWGRGLALDACVAAATAASGGLVPDLTLVFDVDVRTSRIRRRIDRIRNHTLGSGGRKGLAGSALKERIRTGYSEWARRHDLPLFHVERCNSEELARRVIRVLEHPGAPVHETEDDARPQWMVEPGLALEQALEALPLPVALYLSQGLRSARALRASAVEREPELCAWALDLEDPLREHLLEIQPEYAFAGLERRPLGGPADPRIRLLDRFPAPCVLALKHLRGDPADAARMAVAETAPGAVIASLAGRDDPFATALRQRLWPQANPDDQAASLVGCDGDEAWLLRHLLVEHDPAAAVESLRRVPGPRADALLDRHADRCPRTVLRALAGRADPGAFALRERLFETGREVLDSVLGLASAPAWDLRERGLERWPSTAIHSVLGLPDDAGRRDFVARCARAAGGDVHATRRIRELDEWEGRPAWAPGRATIGDGSAQ